MKSAFFSADLENGSIGGCIIEGQGYEPANKGSLVYLNGGDDLSVALSKVEQAGGKIIMLKLELDQTDLWHTFKTAKETKLDFTQ